MIPKIVKLFSVKVMLHERTSFVRVATGSEFCRTSNASQTDWPVRIPEG
jgi:hypothetical protein